MSGHCFYQSIESGESVQLWARNIRQHSWLGSTFTVLVNEGSGKWEAVRPEIHGQALWQVTEVSWKIAIHKSKKTLAIEH